MCVPLAFETGRSSARRDEKTETASPSSVRPEEVRHRSIDRSSVMRDDPRRRRRRVRLPIDHPRVRRDLGEAQPVPRILLEHALEEVARVGRQADAPVPDLPDQIPPDDDVELLVRSVGLVVGGEARQHDVEDDPGRPHVDRVPVEGGLVREDLG
mmetsp:Transcript_27832/g.65426  ORF Transcript_27832/g.65426 Transcript_27832/m.65426 type:complete len:155 (+) Transcript_27832:202-666(+)